MNRKIFEWNVRLFSENKAAHRVLFFLYHILPIVMLVAYPALLVYALIYMRGALPRLIAVPLGVFAGVTVMRVLIDEERPYERYGIPPVYPKDTKGKSFPSRHTACAFIIAMAFWYVSTPLGIAATVIAALIELSRILAGAHYIHDVLCGMAIAIVTGVMFFFLL